jgi:TPR repeat protein
MKRERYAPQRRSNRHLNHSLAAPRSVNARFPLQGVGASETKAFELYEKAAMRGSPVAMYRLGQCYEHGKVRARPASLSP